MKTPRMGDDQKMKEYYSIREEAGRHIDPATAEVDWEYGQTLDPYGIEPDLPEECQQIGRVYFARSPGSDIWVWFGDLPEATRTALWEKHEHVLAFPAGFEIGRLAGAIADLQHRLVALERGLGVADLNTAPRTPAPLSELSPRDEKSRASNLFPKKFLQRFL